MDDIKDIEAAVWPKKRVFLPWAAFYSAFHVFFCLYAFGDHGPVTTNGQQLAIYGMLFGPAFYFADLYIRFFLVAHQARIRAPWFASAEDQRSKSSVQFFGEHRDHIYCFSSYAWWSCFVEIGEPRLDAR